MHKQFNPHIQCMRTMAIIGPQMPQFQKEADSRVWKEGQDEEDDIYQCIICLKPRKVKEDLWILPCGHFYHKHCILDWARTKNTCPICRQSFSGTDDRTLLLREDRKRRSEGGGGGGGGAARRGFGAPEPLPAPRGFGAPDGNVTDNRRQRRRQARRDRRPEQQPPDGNVTDNRRQRRRQARRDRRPEQQPSLGDLLFGEDDSSDDDEIPDYIPPPDEFPDFYPAPGPIPQDGLGDDDYDENFQAYTPPAEAQPCERYQGNVSALRPVSNFDRGKLVVVIAPAPNDRCIGEILGVDAERGVLNVVVKLRGSGQIKVFSYQYIYELPPGDDSL